MWYGALSKILAQRGPLDRENLPTFLQIRVVRCLGVANVMPFLNFVILYLNGQIVVYYQRIRKAQCNPLRLFSFLCALRRLECLFLVVLPSDDQKIQQYSGIVDMMIPPFSHSILVNHMYAMRRVNNLLFKERRLMKLIGANLFNSSNVLTIFWLCKIWIWTLTSFWASANTSTNPCSDGYASSGVQKYETSLATFKERKLYIHRSEKSFNMNVFLYLNLIAFFQSIFSVHSAAHGHQSV